MVVQTTLAPVCDVLAAFGAFPGRRRN